MYTTSSSNKNNVMSAGTVAGPQYHYISTSGVNGQSPTTIVFESYNDSEVGGDDVNTVIKFQNQSGDEEYQTIKSASCTNNDVQVTYETIAFNKIENKANHHSAIRFENYNSMEDTECDKIIKFDDQNAAEVSYEEYQSMKNNDDVDLYRQQQQVEYKMVQQHEEEINKKITEFPVQGPIAAIAATVKQKRKRKTRVAAEDEQGEYLEKMSVRGLDIQRYEHIIDGVSYCLVCAKNDIYKTFKNKYSFQRHAYLFHEGDNRKIFACPICNKEFSRPDKMKMHKKDKHSDAVDSTMTTKGVTDVQNASAKRTRNTTNSKTSRIRKPRNAAAAEKRLAQIDSVLDKIQKEDCSSKAVFQNQKKQLSQWQQQPEEPQHELQSLDLSGMILPGGAQLQIATPTATILQQQTRQQQHLTISQPSQHGPIQNTNGATLIYSNHIDLQQALLQHQLQGPIMIQDQAGNLMTLQTLQQLNTLDVSGAQTIYTTQSPSRSQQQLLQRSPPHQLTTYQPQQHIQMHAHIIPQHQHLSHIKRDAIVVSSNQQEISHVPESNTSQHQPSSCQQNFDLDNVTYLTPTTATTPTAASSSTEQHVIGTVQSYQLLTPDGLQNYQAATNKLESVELELCPYTTLNSSATTPHYTFSTNAHLTPSNGQELLHAETFGDSQASHQFMELKNELLIKNSDSYALDAPSVYHLPFSPTSIINTVNDVNSSPLVEPKEISAMIWLRRSA